MTVLVITPWFPSYPESQFGSFVLDSVEALVASGHSVTVLVTRAYGRRNRLERTPAAKRASQMRRREFDLVYCRYLGIPGAYGRCVSNELFVRCCRPTVTRLLARKRFDVIHAHSDLAGYLAIRLKFQRPPVVTTLHGINTEPRYAHGLGQDAFFRTVCSRPERLVIVGEPLRAFVSTYCEDMHHVRVVPNGFRQGDAGHRRVRDAEVLQLISVSNLVDGKGIDTNLLALERLSGLGIQNWHYHIVGGGPWERRLAELTERLGLSERVTFYGQVDHDRVLDLLSRAEVFTLPSSPEAFGVAYLEAMANGVMVIGAEGEGPAAFVTSGVNGILIPAGNVARLADALATLFRERSVVRRMAAAGEVTARTRYTAAQHAHRLSAVYREAIEAHQSRASGHSVPAEVR